MDGDNNGRDKLYSFSPHNPSSYYPHRESINCTKIQLPFNEIGLEHSQVDREKSEAETSFDNNFPINQQISFPPYFGNKFKNSLSGNDRYGRATLHSRPPPNEPGLYPYTHCSRHMGNYPHLHEIELQETISDENQDSISSRIQPSPGSGLYAADAATPIANSMGPEKVNNKWKLAAPNAKRIKAYMKNIRPIFEHKNQRGPNFVRNNISSAVHASKDSISARVREWGFRFLTKSLQCFNSKLSSSETDLDNLYDSYRQPRIGMTLHDEDYDEGQVNEETITMAINSQKTRNPKNATISDTMPNASVKYNNNTTPPYRQSDGDPKGVANIDLISGDGEIVQLSKYSDNSVSGYYLSRQHDCSPNWRKIEAITQLNGEEIRPNEETTMKHLNLILQAPPKLVVAGKFRLIRLFDPSIHRMKLRCYPAPRVRFPILFKYLAKMDKAKKKVLEALEDTTISITSDLTVQPNTHNQLTDECVDLSGLEFES